MASLFLAEHAISDLEELSDFLAERDPRAAEATSGLIIQALRILAAHPMIGRSTGEKYRELVISRGHTGYIALYEYQQAYDRVLVHGIRHQREAGFDE